MGSDAGRAALAQRGFRAPDRAPLDAGRGVGDVAVLTVEDPVTAAEEPAMEAETVRFNFYVFLGTILTDLVLPSTGPSKGTICPDNCKACQKACPTGALTDKGCDVSKCLSDWTQQKGELPPDVEKLVRESPTVWGCDLCQRACPHNKTAELSTLPEFTEDLTHSLTAEDLEGLSNKAFRKAFAHKAFAWRGITPLKRNLSLKEK